MIEDLWFWLVAGMLAAYVVLDGFDLGAGVASLLAARGERERRAVLRSIGPVWDGNEVWLIAAGGTLFFAFPGVYAAAFSGFYLPLMIVLWLLIFRGIAVELRNHLEGPVWRPAWDAVFACSSALLAMVFGAALGNVVRGVPLDAQGRFFVPLWTGSTVGGFTGFLDSYTLLTGLLSLAALTLHGSLWVSLKTGGVLRDRARLLAGRAWLGSAVLAVAATGATFHVQPRVLDSFREHPLFWVLPAAALAALMTVRALLPRGDDLRAFLASCTFLAAMMGTAAAGLHPVLLPSTLDPALSLTVENSAAPSHGLGLGLAWWLPGMALVVATFVFTYGRLAGRVDLEEGGGH